MHLFSSPNMLGDPVREGNHTGGEVSPVPVWLRFGGRVLHPDGPDWATGRAESLYLCDGSTWGVIRWGYMSESRKWTV